MHIEQLIKATEYKNSKNHTNHDAHRSITIRIPQLLDVAVPIALLVVGEQLHLKLQRVSHLLAHFHHPLSVQIAHPQFDCELPLSSLVLDAYHAPGDGLLLATDRHQLQFLPVPVWGIPLWNRRHPLAALLVATGLVIRGIPFLDEQVVEGVLGLHFARGLLIVFT